MIRVLTATKRRPDGAALTIAVALALLGGLLVWQAAVIPDKGGYAGIGSGALPRFIGIGLFALSAAHLWTAVKTGADPIARPHMGPVVWIVGGLLLQILLLRSAGFSIASGLLFALTAAGFGRRRLLVTVPVGVGLALAIYGVFDQLLKLKLPAGLLETLIFGG
ncbi:tripartite tricarboxylate transporter TctB family protein [Paragemmobacter straminiformis]|uniref:Tripartite tricarboxylate transporter TctB family protein n=1 Tax=Paragemmobacter straminiformis TaxID=2045119 RepID=A0A842I868_9RHOB|nr:tripartite tricarboxylate transporter TctB family protein [Gemmobacter straminiformis]MBC2835825.1 tripartite tricarboxylate transporter TctB family protein [Gemmobacter straminiformis]